MPRPKKKPETLDHQLPFRVTPSMLRRIQDAGNHMQRSDQDTMRLTMDIGLEVLKAIDYDLGAVIAQHFLSQLATLKPKSPDPV